MCVKEHFSFSHLEQLPPNLGDVSNDQGKRLHQDLKARCQDNWIVNTSADYCWNLKRDFPYNEDSRESHKRKKSLYQNIFVAVVHIAIDLKIFLKKYQKTFKKDILKLNAPGPFHQHTFLHRINTS